MPSPTPTTRLGVSTLAWLLMHATSGAAAATPVLPAPHLSYRAVVSAAPASDPAPADWRERNQLVHRLGGHAGHTGVARPTPPARPSSSGAASR